MPVPVPQQRAVPAVETTHVADLTLLVIEDDPAGTFTVPELPAAAGDPGAHPHRPQPDRGGPAPHGRRRLHPAGPGSAAQQRDTRRARASRGLQSSPPSSTSCGSRHATPSSRSPRRTTPSWPPRRCVSAPRTISSAASSTDGCSPAPSATPSNANAPTWRSTSSPSRNCAPRRTPDWNADCCPPPPPGLRPPLRRPLPPRTQPRAARRGLLRHGAYARRHRSRDDRRRLRPRPGRGGARRRTAHSVAGIDAHAASAGTSCSPHSSRSWSTSGRARRSSRRSAPSTSLPTGATPVSAWRGTPRR